MDEKLNIFEVLKQINNKNFNYLDELPEKLSSQFNSYITYQWLTCTDNTAHFILLSKYVNDAVLELAQHPKLLYKLFCATSCGKNTRYNWKYKKKEASLKLQIVAEYFECSKRVASFHIEELSQQDIKTMAYELGYQESELKKLN